ncbi:Macoilin, partial [Blattella germanica]
STLLYLKFLVLWALVLLADFILEFRFEFLWPFWLLLRSVYDSFKYQGLAFSVFFICIALTSDMICFFFIPVHWLFFAASTYVWVQYVWHTEKGVCLPTIILWLLFVYIEAAIRLRDLRHLPFHLDLCRPFAAHWVNPIMRTYKKVLGPTRKSVKSVQSGKLSIRKASEQYGIPYTTLNDKLKNRYKCKIGGQPALNTTEEKNLRKQKDVSKENEFYMQLLQQALPLEQQQTQQPLPQQQQQTCHNTSPEKSRGGASSADVGISNGVAHHTAPAPQTSTTKNNHRKSLDKGEKDKCVEVENKSSEKSAKYSHTNGSIHTELEFIERVGSVNDFDENEVEKDKSLKGSVQPLKSNSSSKWSNNQARENAVNTQRERKNKANRENAENANHHKDEYCIRLEADVKRLKTDLQSSRQMEQDLRSQINTLISGEKSIKNELGQLQQDNDDLQSKWISKRFHNWSVGFKRNVAYEIHAKHNWLLNERLRKQKKLQQPELNECTDSCRARRRDLETEGKQLRRELKIKDDRFLAAEREMQSLRQYKESHNEAEILMSALSAMQDKNAHLENSLSAETRIKLDLFSALGEAKRQLEIRESVIRAQEKEIEELKSKIAQVLAVMPTDTFVPGPTNGTGMSKLRLAETPSPCPGCTVSNLDPNATAYTPKGSLITSTEA